MNIDQDTKKDTSLLIRILNKVDAMSRDEQQSLWLQLNQKELLEKAKFLDKGINPSHLTEDEIVALCKSNNNS